MVGNSNPRQQATQRLVLDAIDGGDTLIAFHAGFNPHGVWDTATVSLTAPTGNSSNGFGTGKVTFDFNNLTEKYIHQTGFLLNLGLGNSSSLVNNLVTQNYTSVGKLAHFQTGAIFWICQRYSIQSTAYEQLPIGSQTVYVSDNPPQNNRNAVPPTPGTNPSVEVVTSTGASEDNGFITSVGIPLNEHFTLSGYYDRSLRHNLDMVSFGMTYVLRGSPLRKRLSIIDRALREAAGVDQQ